MAFYHLYITLLLLYSSTPLVSSLSTFSISETSSQTMICALTINSSDRRASALNCTSTGFPVNSSASSVSGIVSGDGFLCSLRTFSSSSSSSSSTSSSSSSVMHCWRFSANNGTVTDHKRIYRGPALHQLQAGNSHICGLVNGINRLKCWQWPEIEFNSNSTQDFTSIAVGEDFVCGLSQTGNISCLGTANTSTSVIGPDRVPRGTFSVISAGFSHVCAIKDSDRGLVCWGEMVGEEEVPQGKFKGLAMGENRSCALRDDGTVVCWGQNNFTLPTALQGTFFVSIEAKRSVFCGVLTLNFSLYCWGSEAFRSKPMVFEQILPGTCTRTCPCGSVLPGSGILCSEGESICQPCDRETPPSVSPPPPPPPVESSTDGWNGKMVALLVVGCVGSLSSALVSAYFLYRYCGGRGCRVHDSGRLDEASGAPSQHGESHREHPQPQPPTPVLEKRLSQLASMGNAGHLEEFSLQVLLEITNNFSDDHKIGTGSFGSVYQGTLEDGCQRRRQVAIKRAEISNASPSAIVTKRQEDRDYAFLNELESLSRLLHKNLVRLLGFCEDCNELLLVYEFMSNGSLHDHLHSLESSPLMSWPNRIKVALDAARGIEYLHEYAVPSIIHRDIKSSNILLDATWTAKVSDFGFSLMGPEDEESHISQRVAGTVGYIDPEYFRLQKLTTKSDVYSFGVVLLEMLSGCRAIHKNENGMPRNVVDFVVPYITRENIPRVLDPKVPPPTPYEIEALTYVGYLAADCVHLQGRDRPTMAEIVNKLERAMDACLVPAPSLSRSTTRSSI